MQKTVAKFLVFLQLFAVSISLLHFFKSRGNLFGPHTHIKSYTKYNERTQKLTEINI